MVEPAVCVFIFMHFAIEFAACISPPSPQKQKLVSVYSLSSITYSHRSHEEFASRDSRFGFINVGLPSLVCVALYSVCFLMYIRDAVAFVA
jgi:hypothetical protein